MSQAFRFLLCSIPLTLEIQHTVCDLFVHHRQYLSFGHPYWKGLCIMRIKKGILSISIVTAILSFYTISLASEEGVPFHALPIEHELRKNECLVENKYLQEILLFPEEPFQADEAGKIAESLDRVPDSILRQAANRKIKIKLFNGSLTDQKHAEHLKGITPRGYSDSNKTWDSVPGMGGSRIVYVKIGHSEKGKGHGSINLELHEFAHTLDKMVYNNIRYQEKFLRIWKKEADLLFPNQAYFLNHPEEYFAEAFATYYFSEETRKIVKWKAPRTYQFIKKLK